MPSMSRKGLSITIAVTLTLLVCLFLLLLRSLIAPNKIHVAAEEAMVDLLKANPQMYLDEVQDWLVNEWDIDVSVPTVQRCVKRLNCTRKRTERINPDQDPQLRALWLYKIASQYSANQLVVVDESAATERTRDRRWAWSPRGVVCRVTQDSPRSSR